MSVTAFQLDNSGLLIHAIPILAAADKGHLQVLAAPPEIPTGSVAQWNTALNPVSDGVEYGTEGTGTWSVLEDHRKDTLWTAYQAPYTVGAEVGGQTYDGLGPVPAWLFATEPEIPLATAQANQITLMYQGYQAAITQPVSFETAAGVTQTYQADANSQNILLQSYTGFEAAGAVPEGFYWVAADNTQVAFTLADLKGLYQAMLAQGWAAFQHLQDKKAAIRATTKLADALAVAW